MSGIPAPESGGELFSNEFPMTRSDPDSDIPSGTDGGRKQQYPRPFKAWRATGSAGVGAAIGKNLSADGRSGGVSSHAGVVPTSSAGDAEKGSGGSGTVITLRYKALLVDCIPRERTSVGV